jgi:hypothetical protein
LADTKFVESLENRFVFSALPAGFVQTVIATNIGPTSAVAALPDGRVLVADQAGILRIAVGGKVPGQNHLNRQK